MCSFSNNFPDDNNSSFEEYDLKTPQTHKKYLIFYKICYR